MSITLRAARESVAALEEMVAIRASAAVVFGTAREKMLSDESFSIFWDEFARTQLPLCVHMGASYPPFEEMDDSLIREE